MCVCALKRIYTCRRFFKDLHGHTRHTFRECSIVHNAWNSYTYSFTHLMAICLSWPLSLSFTKGSETLSPNKNYSHSIGIRHTSNEKKRKEKRRKKKPWERERERRMTKRPKQRHESTYTHTQTHAIHLICQNSIRSKI